VYIRWSDIKAKLFQLFVLFLWHCSVSQSEKFVKCLKLLLDFPSTAVSLGSNCNYECQVLTQCCIMPECRFFCARLKNARNGLLDVLGTRLGVNMSTAAHCIFALCSLCHSVCLSVLCFSVFLFIGLAAWNKWMNEWTLISTRRWRIREYIWPQWPVITAIRWHSA